MRFYHTAAGRARCELSDGSVWEWPVDLGGRVDDFLRLCRSSAHAPLPCHRLTPDDVRNTWVAVH